jgi:hypothetical protein
MQAYTQSEEKTREYLARFNSLKEKRQPFETNYWRPIGDYLLPRRGWFDDLEDPQRPGRRRQDKIINNQPSRSLRILAAGMQGGLTSPARQWFQLSLADSNLSGLGRVREYLGEVQARMYKIFASSNFYSSIHMAYTELAGFGTCCLLEDEDLEKGVRFKTLTAGEYYLAEDRRGRVDTVYRTTWMSATQMAQEFGRENLSDSVKSALEHDPDHSFQVLHLVEPRTVREPGSKNALNMPWRSVYLELEGGGNLLRKGGYEEFPYLVSRWSVFGGEVYGRGPGCDVLPDIKMLQEMEKTHLKALHKMADPPVKKPSTLSHPVNALPGGVTPYDASNPHALAPLYEVRPNTGELDVKIQRVENAIAKAMFNDVFLFNTYIRGMTATEVEERREEKLLMLGPVIERQTHELLDPLINRTYQLMNRRGMLPTPPREIQGMEIKVEFISHLAQAQKVVLTRGIRAISAFVADLSRLSSQAMDLFDVDQAVRQFAEAAGTPVRLIRGAGEVEDLRRAKARAMAKRAQDEEQEKALARLPKTARAAKDLSQANKLGHDPLAQVAKLMQTKGSPQPQKALTGRLPKE